MKRTAVSATLSLSIALLAADAVSAKKLTVARDNWTADQLYDDFRTEFGADVSACYPATAFDLGPANPEDETAATAPWKKAVIVLDASGSMAGKAGGERKMDAAKSAIQTFMAQVPADAQLGLAVFGHRGNNKDDGKAESCAGIEMIEPIANGNAGVISAQLADIDATGWTPLASAITEAAKGFTPSDRAGEQVLFIVSDGNETCGGDPVAAARALHDSNIKGIVHIIGYDVDEKARNALAEVAAAGGGSYFSANSGNELGKQLSEAARTVSRQATFEAQSVNTVAGNDSKAAISEIDAAACVTRAHIDELTNFTLIQMDLTAAGKISDETAKEVTKRIEDRQKAENERLERFKADVTAARDAANAPISDSLKQAD